MATFPFSFVPSQAWSGKHKAHRYFGAPREHGRLHAGCDLIADVGTPVMAVDDGTVLCVRDFSISYLPGVHVKQVAVRHRFYTVRYCEVGQIADGIHDGVQVHQGQVIAYVGKLRRDAMLHFELYQGDRGGFDFTVRGNSTNYKYLDKPGNYQRRFDLRDPTELLNSLRAFVGTCHG